MSNFKVLGVKKTRCFGLKPAETRPNPSQSLGFGNFPVGLTLRKGLKSAPFLRPKRIPKTEKRARPKIPNQTENYLCSHLLKIPLPRVRILMIVLCHGVNRFCWASWVTGFVSNFKLPKARQFHLNSFTSFTVSQHLLDPGRIWSCWARAKGLRLCFHRGAFLVVNC